MASHTSPSLHVLVRDRCISVSRRLPQYYTSQEVQICTPEPKPEASKLVVMYRKGERAEFCVYGKFTLCLWMASAAGAFYRACSRQSKFTFSKTLPCTSSSWSSLELSRKPQCRCCHCACLLQSPQDLQSACYRGNRGGECH